MKNKFIYITYQSFPSNKANTIQTIENIKHISKAIQLELVFPKREKSSSDKLIELQKFYSFNEEFVISMTQHNLPFGKISILKKYLFLISHFLWARQVSKKYNNNASDIFFTRSDWIFFFLSKKEINITFECHQLTKLRKWLIYKSIKYKKSKLICLNRKILEDLKLSEKDANKVLVLPNGVDTSNFSKINHRNSRELLFIGNLNRFEDDRNLKFILDCFSSSKLDEKIKFKIIGGPDKYLKILENYSSELKIDDKVTFLSWQKRDQIFNEIQKSDIGLLMNSSKDKHSVFHTSPLKYFEYLYAGLNILAVDFPSHRSLPYSKFITFFKENDKTSFINSLNALPRPFELSKDDLFNITLESRVEKILSFTRN